jgi:hypothetical protein
MSQQQLIFLPLLEVRGIIRMCGERDTRRDDENVKGGTQRESVVGEERMAIVDKSRLG